MNNDKGKSKKIITNFITKVKNKEKTLLTTKIICVLLVILVLAILMFFLENNEVVQIFFTGSCTIGAALIAVWGVSNTINSNQELKNQELLNDLDQKSEWRKELMNIAAKPVMELEDIFRILASLRFLPKDEKEIKESDQPKFDEISNYIYKHLNEMLNDTLKKVKTKNTLSDKGIKIKMSIKESEEIRLYTKFLLKHHWEYNQSEKDRNDFKEKELTEFFKVIDEVKRLNDINEIKSNKFYLTEGDENIEELYKNWKEDK